MYTKNKKLVVKVTLSPSCSNLFDKELYKQGHNKPRKYDMGFLVSGIPNQLGAKQETQRLRVMTRPIFINLSVS